MIWYDNYNIGDEQIDSQHQQLAKTIRTLQKSLVNGRFSPEAGETLKFLVDYTKHHFSEEEALMEKINYDGLEAHRVLHKKLVAQVVEILLDLKKGHRLDAYEIIDFHTDWLTHHI
ncbi:MAG: bacteriohemerythrin, partial [Spirochaetales bacterium]|nr:bacteriohemerythrin [Spirochaetales bacterium]